MKTAEKLKIIKKISKKTQQELAGELGVSFATLNSWINGKSQPHLSNRDRIDELYRELTGQKIIPENELKAKKKLIQKRSIEYKNIIRYINKNPDIYDELLLQLTYNSNSIEGSTFTLAETASVLFDNAALKNKDLREHMEAKNHQAAFDYLMQAVDKNFVISEEFILKLHRILMNGLRKDAGTYRNHSVRIVGANVPTANHVKVPELMGKLVDKINTKTEDTVGSVSTLHSEFEKIHPFSDGNGRVGRLIAAAQFLRENIAPAVIKENEKQRYYAYLQASQLKGENAPLEDFIADAVLFGFDIIDRLDK